MQIGYARVSTTGQNLDLQLDEFEKADCEKIYEEQISKMEALEEKGVDFVFLSEGIDTTTAQGKLTFHIFGALAEFERELSRGRTMAGLKAARGRGGDPAGPVAYAERGSLHLGHLRAV
ncbi:recombinase family protein [Salinibacter grassmerensis]|uniref:recombinase family protein n=1 Tax=Salinibacter grassmerensis TaxID=3040353 RepID=UPI0021E9563A|nr:recombinase family protein [Salinibacter grassmerensis]